MSIPPKAIYRFNAIPIKIPLAFFYKTRTNDPKICIEPEKTQKAKAILRKNKDGGITLLDFKLHYKAIVT